MIKRIFCFFTLSLLLVSLSLALAGVTHIEFGRDYYNWLSNLTRTIGELNWSIPSIPMIEYFSTGTFGSDILSFLVSVVNGLSTLINFVISFCNVIVSIVSFCSAVFIVGLADLKASLGV